MQYTVRRARTGDFFVNGKLVKQITGKSGGYRFVGITADGEIFKADIKEKGCAYFGHQTYTEIDRYQHIDADDLKHFPLILGHGTYSSADYSWLISEKVVIKLDHTVSRRMAGTLKRLMSSYDLGDIGDTREGDIVNDYSNFTVVGRGRPMIYDFAV